MATLYEKIRSWVRTKLEMTEARWDIAYIVAMLELYDDLHTHIDAFVGHVES